MLWILINAALAGDCPWSTTPVNVDAGWKTVTVDGVPYSTDSFAGVLTDCGEAGAVIQLEKWQSMRKLTVGLGAAGLCLYFPWLGAPITGLAGIMAREDLEEFILDGYSAPINPALPYQVPGSPGFSESSGCCKHCATGKPCGDSCISKDAVCSKSGGCACY